MTVALVTGANRGIGLEVVRQLAQQDISVILTARDLQKAEAAELSETNILINAACPGPTATAPGMEAMGARPIPEGAASIVWAALLPDGSPSGGFFRDGQALPW